mgnify:CR=1 FL=1
MSEDPSCVSNDHWLSVVQITDWLSKPASWNYEYIGVASLVVEAKMISIFLLLEELLCLKS